MSRASKAKGKRSQPRSAYSATRTLLLGLVLGITIGASATYLTLVALWPPAPALIKAPQALRLLPDREYFAVVSSLISRANRSVYVAMFVMKYDPGESPERDPANALIVLVTEVAARGLDVRVVVDDTTKKSYPHTIAYLKARGVQVRLDPEAGVYTHVKIVIIDGEWVMLGSHNWTESALGRNYELSVLIRSRQIAEEVKRYFSKLWEGGRRV